MGGRVVDGKREGIKKPLGWIGGAGDSFVQKIVAG